jgi:uncharacterized protein YjiS (DUF1127 family)
MAYITINNVERIPATTAACAILARALATVLSWRRRARDRAELAQLTARDARDLGLDPGVISFEASKPFWRA